MIASRVSLNTIFSASHLCIIKFKFSITLKKGRILQIGLWRFNECSFLVA